MRSLQEVEQQAQSVLVGDEDIVWTTRVHGGWMLLTNRRLLMWKDGRRGRPLQSAFDEPLDRIEVASRWSWSKLDRVLVVRRADGVVWLVAQAWGQRRSGGNDKATWLRKTTRDIRAWTLLAEITGAQAAGGRPFDIAFARVHARVLASLTPAQLARDVGVEPSRVQALLEGWGLRFSEGALSGYTYTKRDRLQLDAGLKERLFVALVDELGADGVVQSASHVGRHWWETSAGELVESVTALLDWESEHVSERRAPIAVWDSRMMRLGSVGAALGALLVFPPYLWLSSRKRWREGVTDRPDAAISIGLLTAAVLLAIPTISLGRLVAG